MSKNQWDFGELFPTEATRRILTVSELTTQVKRLVEKQIGLVWVTGEITNLRTQSSGHIYFTLKDAVTQLACVLFRGESVPQRSLMQDGQKVILQGDITVYEARGQYQMLVRAVEVKGVGALQIAFEKLKRKLEAEGLFAPERKRTLPEYPWRIGLVTSPAGAAIRDVLHVIQRRQPGLEIILAPCRVQGQGAAEEIAAAIRLLNEYNARVSGGTPSGFSLDMILVTRGGGSLEDLWAFNEEVVARAIFESALPVVSAVGHEIDFTISDFVADLRAATPSAAAELITEAAFASREFVAEAAGRLHQLMLRNLDQSQSHLEEVIHRLALVHPRRRLNEQWQRLDELQSALVRGAGYRYREVFSQAQGLVQRLRSIRPGQLILRRLERLQDLDRQLRRQAAFRLAALQSSFQTVQARLRLLSPQSVLDRGYSITTDAASDKIIRSAGEVVPGQRLRTRLKAGEIASVAEAPSVKSKP